MTEATLTDAEKYSYAVWCQQMDKEPDGKWIFVSKTEAEEIEDNRRAIFAMLQFIEAKGFKMYQLDGKFSFGKVE